MATPFVHELATLEESDILVIVCAWCKKKQRDGERWGPLRNHGADAPLSHGICPECFAVARAAIESPGEHVTV